MITISVLGATGSVGRQTLEVAAWFPERIKVAAVTAHRDVGGLAEACRRFNPRLAVMTDAARAPALEERLREHGLDIGVAAGEAGLRQAASLPEVDTVVSAIVGVAGLPGTLAGIEAGKRVALANKESLIAAGDLVRQRLAAGGSLVPLDSEHSALFQCLHGHEAGEVAELILTASGGPFLRRPRAQLAGVGPEEALAHPRWDMGAKISIDSATLMNKGLEVIEAHHLFEAPYDTIDVLIHPQSLVHGLIRFSDGSLLAHMGPTDMRLPILYALGYPRRWTPPVEPLDLAQVGQLTFEEPDPRQFPALELAYAAGREGGTAPAVLSAANEVAVQAFLQERIPFLAITDVVAQVLAAHQPQPARNLEAVLTADGWARQEAGRCIDAYVA